MRRVCAREREAVGIVVGLGLTAVGWGALASWRPADGLRHPGWAQPRPNHHKRLLGPARGKRVHPYAPLRRLHWGLNEQADAEGGGIGNFMSVVRSFLKERVANLRDFQTVNLIESWQSHNRQANHIIHLHDWISTVGRVMRHADMQTALDFTVGDKTRRALNAWLDIQARGGSMVIRDDGIPGALARNFAVAVTTNPRVTLKQLTSPGMALGMLPPGASTLDWFKDMAEIAFPGEKRREFLAFLDGNSPEWRERGLNASDALQLINRHKAGDKFELLRLKVQRKLGAMTRWGDRNGALLGCYGVFRAWERKLAAEGMDPAAAKIAALEKFVESVNAGQQSTLPEYVSKVQTMGGLYPEFPYSPPFSTFSRRLAVEFSRKFACPASRKPPKRRVVKTCPLASQKGRARMSPCFCEPSNDTRTESSISTGRWSRTFASAGACSSGKRCTSAS